MLLPLLINLDMFGFKGGATYQEKPSKKKELEKIQREQFIGLAKLQAHKVTAVTVTSLAAPVEYDEEDDILALLILM